MVKYVIRAKIEIEGTVDKSDVIGAIFGYTEGIFGEEFDLRELQDKGRVGRISVELKQQDGKSIGEILIPSNLDRVETALLASLIECVERVGPYSAKIQIIDIVDVRAERIKKIIDRASEIAKRYFVEKAPDIKEILNKITENVRSAEMSFYGPERLPAGPDVDKGDTIIIVEGRADVQNMLRYGYRNVIALEGAHGTKIPETIIKLAAKKTVILFVDGDRAGELIARDVIRIADIDYVARAPPGKEVEELTAKEIAKALKNALPVKQFLEQLEKKTVEIPEIESKSLVQQPITQTSEVVETTPLQQAPIQISQQILQQIAVEKPVESPIEIPVNVIEESKKILGNLEALLYDEQWNVLERIPVRDIVDKLGQIEYGKVQAIIFDGIITQRLLDTASSKGVKLIIGVRLGNVVKKPENLITMTFNDILSAIQK
ncbi:MAG: DNA primase DnaG [Ignisphaera sp.]|uniref:DNA primase DnaG n=1 Tax=Ignisphaera aggregans TaxID=334771 RepID=A0A7C4JJ77_9CREN